MAPGRDDLTRADLLGPMLAAVTGDDRWRRLTVELITGGKSNLTYFLASGAGRLVLRRPPTGDLLPTAHDMTREARVQRALAPTAVPVPRIVLEHDGSVLGFPCYVMAEVDGHVNRDGLPRSYAQVPGAPRRLAHALVDTLADLHAIDPAAVGLDDFGRPEGFMARQVRRWVQQWERSRGVSVAPSVDALAAALAGRVPDLQRAVIVHGDYRLDNVMVDREDPGRIVAVLDWEMATLGDPLADLGMLLFYWREPGEVPVPAVPATSQLPGFPGRRELAERYAARTGLDLSQVALYEAFAHFKFAVIVQGVAARVAAGAMGGQDFGDVDRMTGEVARLAEDGLRLIEEG